LARVRAEARLALPHAGRVAAHAFDAVAEAAVGVERASRAVRRAGRRLHTRLADGSIGAVAAVRRRDLERRARGEDRRDDCNKTAELSTHRDLPPGVFGALPPPLRKIARATVTSSRDRPRNANVTAPRRGGESG